MVNSWYSSIQASRILIQPAKKKKNYFYEVIQLQTYVTPTAMQ
jgi:hypothetical protein